MSEELRTLGVKIIDQAKNGIFCTVEICDHIVTFEKILEQEDRIIYPAGIIINAINFG